MVKSASENKLLLVQSPPWGVYTPPLGIAYLATFLKSLGFSVDILDLNLEIFHRAAKETQLRWDNQDFEFWASGEAVNFLSNQLEGLVDRIISFNASIIGFSTTFASVPFLNRLLELLRGKTENEVIIIGGAGTHSREGRSLFRKDLIDYFVLGEGEYPLACLLRDMKEGKSIPAGDEYVLWKDQPHDRAVCLKSAFENSIDINQIPFPTFEEFDLGRYTQGDLLPLISSRGCIKSCVFCCDAPLKKPYRSRDPENIAREIEYLVGRYNRRRFEFSDLLINGDLNSLNRLCELLIRMDLRVCWGGQATVRKDMSGDLFKKMKKAGCGGLTFGCESFSDRVLRLMHKGMTSRDAKETFVRAKEAGMLVEVNLIVGFPGETEADIDENIKFMKENAKWIDKVNSLNICTIGPGMYIYEHLEEYGVDKSMIRDWYAWFTKDMANTIQIREERHRKLLSVCSEMNLTPVWQNVKK